MPDFCRSCKAPVIWTRTEANDKAMPLDGEPVDDGNIVLVRTHRGERARYIGDLERLALDGQEPLYKSHFATCPHATDHRKR